MKLDKLALVVALAGAIVMPVVANGKQHGQGYRFNADNTRGWSMMTAEERKEHHAKMHAVKNVDECKAVHDEHHKQMEARAKEKGRQLGMPKVDACERMKAHGMIK